MNVTGKSSADRLTVEEFRIDPLVKAMLQIDVEHSRVHAGLLFSLSGTIPTIAAGATVYFHGLTDGRNIHFRAGAVKVDDTPALITFYEGATVSNNGTEIFAKNRRRSSANTPTLRTFINPTVTDVGEELEVGLIPASGPAHTSGIAELFATEWMLDVASTSYLIALTNNSTGPITASYNFLWYETDK